MRDRLIEILIQSGVTWNPCGVADALLDNGVIMPPVKVGDTIYVLDVCATKIIERKVTEIRQSEWGTIYIHSFGFGYPEASIGKTVFLTREQALAEMASGT